MQNNFFYNDLVRSIRNPRPWIALTQRNVRVAYRRSYLGALWISLTVAITIVALSGVYTYLFPITLAEYMPYLTVSYVAWIAISNILLAGPNAFIQYAPFIKQEPLHFSNYVLAVIADKMVIFFNHCLVIVAVLVIFQVPPSITWLIVPLIIPIYFATGLGLGFMFGLLAAKYRDVNQILGSLTQLGFFVTPVLWKPEFLSGRTFIVDLNPFYHYLAILREPLLDHTIPWDSFAVTLAIAVFANVFGIMAMNKKRKMLVYWV